MSLSGAIAAVVAMTLMTLGLVVYEAIMGGLFKSPVVRKCRFGPFVLMYRNVIGPYKNVGSVFEELAQLKKDKKDILKPCNSDLTLGFYFDPPGSTEPSQSRCSVACCIYEGKPVKGEDAALKELVESLSKADWIKDNDLKIAEFPESEVAYVEWPFRGIISIMIGIHKAYPALKQDAPQILGKPLQDILTKGDKPGGSIEIYDQAALKEYVCFSATDRKTMLAFDRPT